MIPSPPPFDVDAALARMDAETAAITRALLKIDYGPSRDVAFARAANQCRWTRLTADTVNAVLRAAGDEDNDIPF